MKKLIIIILLISIVGLLPVALCMWGVIGGKFSCDFVAQIIPLTIEAKKMMLSGMPMWSWNSFLGDNFIGANNFYVVGNPFTLICSLFPYEHIGNGVLLCLVLQNLGYGIAAMLYFRRMGFADELARIGALMYAFSTFCVIGIFYFNFASGFILFPILLICLEDLLERKGYSVLKLAIVVGLAMIVNFYFAALSFIGAGLYFIVRLCYAPLRGKWRIFGSACAALLIGMMLSAIIFVPTVLCSMGSARNVTGSFEVGLFSIAVQGLMRLSYLLIPRFTEGFAELYSASASHSMYVPLVGCTFMLYYIFTHRRNWLSVLLVGCMFILLSPLNIIFSLGANPIYVRWGYIFILFAILATLYEVKEHGFSIHRMRLLIVGITVGAGILLVLLRYALHCFANEGGVSLVALEYAVFVFANVWLYCILSSNNFVSKLQTGVVGVGVVSLFIYSCLLVHREADSSINLILRSGIERSADDTFRYRTDVSGTERNIGYAINAAVPRQFHSILNKSVVELGACFRHSTSPNMIVTHHRESFAALTSVKDVIVCKGDSLPFPSNTVLKKTPNYTTFRNEHYIPMGYAYDSFISESEFKRQLGAIDYDAPENNNDVGVGLLQTLVVADGDAPQFKKYLKEAQTVNFEAPLDSVVNRRRMNTAVNFVGNTTGFKATINNESNRPAVYFFSVPNDSGFTAWMDGNTRLQIYRANLGMMAVVVPQGRHAIEFRYLTPGLKLGAWLSLLGLIVVAVMIGYDYSNTRPK